MPRQDLPPDRKPKEGESSDFWKKNDSLLKQLVDSGCTTVQAAAALGVSKNTVIGRARRRGFEWARAEQYTKQIEEQQEPKIVFPKRNRCVWPHGYPGEKEFRFCGDEIVPGKPYCQHHCNLAKKKNKETEEEDVAV